MSSRRTTCTLTKTWWYMAITRPKAGQPRSAPCWMRRRLRFRRWSRERQHGSALWRLQQQRGLRARRCGCDRFRRSREAQATGVPLTTVRQSFFVRQANALEILLKRLERFTALPVTVTPTQLLIRWSCGCLPENMQRRAASARAGRLENKREAALRSLLNSAGITEQDPALPNSRTPFGRAGTGSY